MKISAYISDHFQIVQTLRATSEKKVLKVRSKISGKIYLACVLTGNLEVYQRLLTIRSPYLPEIYEVIPEGEVITVLEELVAGNLMADMLE